MTNPTELEALFKQAAAIAAQVPEPLREIAFQRALDALQVGATRRVSNEKRDDSDAKSEEHVPTPMARNKNSHSAAVTKLLETLDRTELATLVRGRKVLDRSLFLLRAAQHHGIDALTPNDIATVLAKKFREPTAPNAVRMALDRSPSYTDRRPSAGSYIYSLMAPGEEYLDSLEKNSTAAASGGRPVHKAAVRRGSKPAPAKTSTKEARQTAAGKKRPSSAGRPGPKVVLELLLSEGFFSAARTMTDILTHLREEKTYNYKTSDMTATLQRLVRQNRLSRSRNAENQFQYIAK
ncbi:MAG: hypothetical protein WBQ26_02520 [Gemmatimonadaceae bacterium]